MLLGAVRTESWVVRKEHFWQKVTVTHNSQVRAYRQDYIQAKCLDFSRGPPHRKNDSERQLETYNGVRFEKPKSEVEIRGQ